MLDVKAFLANVSSSPGVYQMLDEHNTIIYIGKAKNLKKRLTSYFRSEVDSIKTAHLVKRICDIKTIVTQNENEALLLENNLIKQFHPRYNILFKDDKSYPYLIFSQDTFPRLDYIRSHKTPKGDYFGPYPNASAVKQSLQHLEKLFKLRNCSNSFFNHRSRPCLQYHIKRCSAPCVGLISQEAYQQDAHNAKLFLQGKNQEIIEQFKQKMDVAANALDFEQAAFYRDQIQQLRVMESKQSIQQGHHDFDAIAAVCEQQHIALQLFIIRHGKIIGDQIYFYDDAKNSPLTEALEYFIAQIYLNTERTIPKQIMLNQNLENQTWLSNVLTEEAKHKVTIKHAQRGNAHDVIVMAEKNALLALKTRLLQQTSQEKRIQLLSEILNLKKIQRIECFDISHTFGEATVASCVVFNEQGPSPKDYRIFNINNITKGDDYAAMQQVLTRRYERLLQHEATLPDVIVIDGGKGQLKQAHDVLASLGINDVTLIGIAKGPTRKSGFEVIWQWGKTLPLDIDEHSPAFHLLQHIRDESHRFAISKHRAKRGKAKQQSILETIPGIGNKKRQALLKHFGGIQGLKQASLADLCKVEGINKALAEKILAVLG